MARHNDGNRLGRILGRLDRRVPSRYHDDINLETHQLGRKLREPIALPLRISVLDGDVLSFYVAKLAQSQPNCLGAGGLSSWDRVSDRYPIRETFFGCCASAMTATASSTTTNRIDKTPAFLIAHSFELCITRAVIEETEIYDGRDRYSSSGKTRFQPEIELNDASV